MRTIKSSGLTVSALHGFGVLLSAYGCCVFGRRAKASFILSLFAFEVGVCAYVCCVVLWFVFGSG